MLDYFFNLSLFCKIDIKFIKINGYKRDRQDITLANPNLSIEWKSDIPFDYEVDNFGTLEEYEKELLNIMRNI